MFSMCKCVTFKSHNKFVCNDKGGGGGGGGGGVIVERVLYLFVDMQCPNPTNQLYV